MHLEFTVLSFCLVLLISHDHGSVTVAIDISITGLPYFVFYDCCHLGLPQLIDINLA